MGKDAHVTQRRELLLSVPHFTGNGLFAKLWANFAPIELEKCRGVQKTTPACNDRTDRRTGQMRPWYRHKSGPSAVCEYRHMKELLVKHLQPERDYERGRRDGDSWLRGAIE